jgi:hypothetical protein
MIRALRIASIAAVVLAAAFFVFPAVFGVQREEETEQFLKSPGIIEQLGKADDRKKTKSDSSQDAPLVKQAEAFALYLNPPQPKEPAEGPVLPTGGDVPRPRMVTPKFELIGTSFYASAPQLSLALIDEPGRGLRWVRQSGEVGHLIIEEVKDGVIVVRDGEKTFELTAERPQKINLIKGSTDNINGEAPPGSEGIKEEDERPKKINLVKGSPGRRSGKGPPRRKEVKVQMEEIQTKLMAMKAKTESGPNDSGHMGKGDAMLDKLISEVKTMRISTEEAKKLGDLGKTLEDNQEEANQPVDKGDVNEEEVNTPAE